jgi:hypothetical protein
MCGVKMVWVGPAGAPTPAPLPGADLFSSLQNRLG